MICRFGSITTLSSGEVHVRFWHKADMTMPLSDVRFSGLKRT
jgi:hypothetical protein